MGLDHLRRPHRRRPRRGAAPGSAPADVLAGLSAVREADDDEHFYGAWKGGKSSEGGRPMTAAERPRQRRGPRASYAKPATKPGLVDALETVGGQRGTTPWTPTEASIQREDSTGLHAGVARQGAGPRAGHGRRSCPSATAAPPSSTVARTEGRPGTSSFGQRTPRAAPRSTASRSKPATAGRGSAGPCTTGCRTTPPSTSTTSFGRSRSFTPAGKAFAAAWLEHRVEVEAERAGIREASSDDHFYGAWKGGPKAAGGGPAGTDGPRVAEGDTVDDVLRLRWASSPTPTSGRRSGTCPGAAAWKLVAGKDGRPRRSWSRTCSGQASRIDEVEAWGGGGYVAERRTPKHVYRAVSEEDLAAFQWNGYIQSDQRMNLSATEGTVASFEPSTFYLPGRLGVEPRRRPPGPHHAHPLRPFRQVAAGPGRLRQDRRAHPP